VYPGWILLADSPLMPGPDSCEIVNNARVQTYAQQAGLCWLLNCADCEAVEQAIPGAPYVSPKDDPAPWYDEENPDTWGFMGVYGLEATGADDSTRHANVIEATTGGGVIGPTYFGSRTIVVRALAVAQGECELQAGIDWLREQCSVSFEPCRGDSFNFFDCCPCLCEDDEPGGPCWARTYRELRLGPICTKDEGDPPRLDPAVGRVTTADPGGLPDIFTVFMRVSGPHTATGGPIVTHGDVTTGPGWEIGRWPNTVINPGGLYFQWNDGTGPRLLEITTTTVDEGLGEDDDNWNDIAITINRDGGFGHSVVSGWYSDNKGLSWILAEQRSVSDPVVAMFDPAVPVQIGGTDTLGFDGTIAQVALVDGATPQTANIVWWFDAGEYPFSPLVPTTWTDARGRDWTVTDAAAMLPQGAGQAGAWWPDTYQELRIGPPMPDEDWCDWVHIYGELRRGPPSFSCCRNDCIIPYFRQFHQARVVEGPVILRHPQLSLSGAMMELEFTIVAADPAEYGLPAAVGASSVHGGPGTLFTDVAPVATVDAFGRVTNPIPRLIDPQAWQRATVAIGADARGRWLSRAVPTIRLQAQTDPAPLTRVGLWDGDTEVCSFVMNSIPADSVITVDVMNRFVSGSASGVTEALPGWAYDWVGPPADLDISRGGPWTLTIDEDDGAPLAPLFVDVISSPVGAR